MKLNEQEEKAVKNILEDLQGFDKEETNRIMAETHNRKEELY